MLKVSYCDHRMAVVRQTTSNHKAEFHKISQEWPLNGPLLKLFKDFHTMEYSGCHGNQKETLKIFLLKTYRADLKIIWHK